MREADIMEHLVAQGDFFHILSMSERNRLDRLIGKFGSNPRSLIVFRTHPFDPVQNHFLFIGRQAAVPVEHDIARRRHRAGAGRILDHRQRRFTDRSIPSRIQFIHKVDECSPGFDIPGDQVSGDREVGIKRKLLVRGMAHQALLLQDRRDCRIPGFIGLAAAQKRVNPGFNHQIGNRKNKPENNQDQDDNQKFFHVSIPPLRTRQNGCCILPFLYSRQSTSSLATIIANERLIS